MTTPDREMQNEDIAKLIDERYSFLTHNGLRFAPMELQMLIKDALDKKDSRIFELETEQEVLANQINDYIDKNKVLEAELEKAKKYLSANPNEWPDTAIRLQNEKLVAERDDLQKRLDFRRKFDGDSSSLHEVIGEAVEALEMADIEGNLEEGTNERRCGCTNIITDCEYHRTLREALAKLRKAGDV